MKIPELHEEIIKLFVKYKIPWETNRLPILVLHDWADGISVMMEVDKDEINRKISELFWSLSDVQLSLGYALIARQTCNYIKGYQTDVFPDSSSPNFLGISEIHVFYHINNAWESLYRCWERMCNLLTLIFFSGTNEKLYFDKLIEKIVSDVKLSNNPKLKKLKSQVKFWNKVANRRNRISHAESAPMRKITYQIGVASVYGSNHEQIPKLTMHFTNILNEINLVKESYLKIVPGILALKEYVEHFVKEKQKKTFV